MLVIFSYQFEVAIIKGVAWLLFHSDSINIIYSNVCSKIHTVDLNPSAWEYRSAALDCNYHTARLSGSFRNINQWWNHLDLFLIASGNVYQWSTEPYMETVNEHTPVQH